MINYLNHSNTRPNINKKIGIQIVFVNLHKLLLVAHIGKCFLVDHLLKVDQDMYMEIIKVFEYEDSRIIYRKLKEQFLRKSLKSKGKQNEIAVPFPYKYETVKGIFIYHMP